jgi:hypothetical protein
MKYAIEMVSGVMIYVHTKLYKDGFRHSEVNKRGFTGTPHGDRLSLVHFLKKEIVNLSL